MGKQHFLAAAYSLAALALVGIAILCDSVQNSQVGKFYRSRTRKLQAKRSFFDQNDFVYKTLAASNSSSSSDAGDSSKEIADYFIKDVNSIIFIKRKDNFSYDPENSKFPDWTPPQIRNGWVFLGMALALSLSITFVALGPAKIHNKYQGWVRWYERSEHIRVGVFFPQFPIHIASGIFSVVGPIFFLRILQVHILTSITPIVSIFPH
jgi:hypothetical protein